MLFDVPGQSLTQTNRLLRLHTPLGPDVLLPETLKGLEGISGFTESIAGFKFELTILSTDPNLELKRVVGQPVLLQIQTDMSREELRPLHGHVTSAVRVGSNASLTRFKITIEPFLCFMSVGRDSAVFQDQDVLTIVETILADYQTGGAYQGAGKLNALWRIDVADRSVYPKRSLTIQYNESDLAFLSRILNEEGLFFWFEHTGDPSSDSFGTHTLVIADHNGAFKPGKRDTIRFSQSSTGIKDDTIDRWRTQARWHTHAVEMTSWDYRTLDVRPVAQHSDGADAASAIVPDGTPALISQDTPGAYAYENALQGQRLATNHLQAITVSGKTVELAGTVRAFDPGTAFTLTEHDGQAEEPHIVLRVIHHARNNLGADLKVQADALDSSAKPSPSALDTLVTSATKPSTPSQKKLVSQADKAGDLFYRNAAIALPLAVPYRAADTDATGQLIHPKPTVQGTQTALVIGVPGNHLTTDRDHRIKVQFAWQRGSNSQSRLAHPAGDEGHSGAPAADDTAATTGTWVRVATPLAPQAGNDWGSVALPRIKQEVIIAFLGGDIDRPVVVGALYNGVGADNAQNNQVAAGAADATGNAPMWFPGDEQAQGKGGKLPGHAHSAVLSGIKTQSMSSSQSGTGAYNQLVFDDTPGQARVGLHSHSQGSSHSGASELNLGALRQQTDNQLLTPTGYGIELKTHHSGAVRAGSGMLLSADARSGNASGAASSQMDAREMVAQLQGAHNLITAVGDAAQAHKAMLPVLQTSEAKPKDQQGPKDVDHIAQVLQDKTEGSGATNTTAALEGGDGASSGGGSGSAFAPGEPILGVSAPGGIMVLTPESATINAGTTSVIAAGQDINFMAQGNAAHCVKDGISMFAKGDATNPDKPNQETGIKLHAASGGLSSQSQSDRTVVTADKSVTVASTTSDVMIQAKDHVVLTAGGAYIKMDGRNIEIVAPGMVEFKAAMKNWTEPKSDSNSLSLPKPGPLKVCEFKAGAASNGGDAVVML